MINLHKNSEITVHELKKLMDLNKNIQLVDVREDSERKHVSIKGTKRVLTCHSIKFLGGGSGFDPAKKLKRGRK